MAKTHVFSLIRHLVGNFKYIPLIAHQEGMRHLLKDQKPRAIYRGPLLKTLSIAWTPKQCSQLRSLYNAFPHPILISPVPRPSQQSPARHQ
jgi:hypothetical protein